MEEPTNVESFWGEYVVCEEVFKDADSLIQHIGERYHNMPRAGEFLELYGNHVDEVVVDYGCGPGIDVIGFALASKARQVIGVDISAKALMFAKRNLLLFPDKADSVQLLHVHDAALPIPLPSESVDFISCNGVVQHVTNDKFVLSEFFRLLKPGGRANLMVYCRNSVFVHIGVAYEAQTLEGQYPGLAPEDAFSRLSDRDDCPIARCYDRHAFMLMCQEVGFKGEFVGGHYTSRELEILAQYKDAALADPRLAEVHKQFLRELTYDSQGYPLHQGKAAGYAGVFRLQKLF